MGAHERSPVAGSTTVTMSPSLKRPKLRTPLGVETKASAATQQKQPSVATQAKAPIAPTTAFDFQRLRPPLIALHCEPGREGGQGRVRVRRARRPVSAERRSAPSLRGREQSGGRATEARPRPRSPSQDARDHRCPWPGPPGRVTRDHRRAWWTRHQTGAGRPYRS